MRRTAALIAVLIIGLIMLAPAPAGAADVHFRYERAVASVYEAVGPHDLIVVGPQAGDIPDGVAVREIHARGGFAYRYVQFYWTPLDRTYQGLAGNLAANKGWGLCQRGVIPRVDLTGHPTPWMFLDLNERTARNAEVRYLRHLQALGYDGVFVDRGGAAFYSEVRSTCTSDPVVRGRTLAQAYVAMLRQIRAVGLRLAFNGGPLPALVNDADGRDALAIGPTFVMDESAARRPSPSLAVNRGLSAARGFGSVILVRPEVIGVTRARTDVAAIRAAGLEPVRGVRVADERAIGG